MSEKQKQFYVYLIYDPRPGKRLAPIYVGKGQGKRADQHWRKHRRKHKNEILRRIFAQCEALGLIPLTEIAARFDTPTAAFAREVKLIAKIGRRCNNTGTLCNISPGGDGFANADESFLEAVRKGYALVKDAVAKQNSTRMTKANRNKAFKALVLAGQRANGSAKNAAATRIMRAATNPNYYDTLASAVSHTWKNKTTRRKRITGIRATSRTPASRARRRAAWTPARRVMQAAVAARTNRDPLHKKSRAAGVARSWRNKSVRARRIAIMRAVQATPESRARKRASWTPARRAAQAERMRKLRRRQKGKQS